MTNPRSDEAARTWLGELSAEQTLQLIRRALSDGEMEAAASLIAVLALKDPAAAELIADYVHLLNGGSGVGSDV